MSEDVRQLIIPPKTEQFEAEGVKYTLRRPTFGARNAFVKKLNIKYDSSGNPVDMDSQAIMDVMFIDMIQLCLAEPKLSSDEIEALDSVIADELFRIANRMVQLAALGGQMGSDIKKT